MLKSMWWFTRRKTKHLLCQLLCPLQYIGDRHLFEFQAYCHRCGGTVHDYQSPDNLWQEALYQAKIEGIIPRDVDQAGGVFCFNCFIELLDRRGILYFPQLGPAIFDDMRLLSRSMRSEDER